MGFEAGHKTIKTIFAGQKKFIIPRFQRTYSWGQEQLAELWRDLLASIIVEDETYKATDYFIGTLVMIGNENSDSLKIVDGQQRLTTITILLSSLVQKFKQVGQEKAAKGLYKFIEGRDLADKEYFKLENEVSKPFLQVTIQNYEQKNLIPSHDEEKNLRKAYEFFEKRLDVRSLGSEFEEYGLPARDYQKMLEIVRDQALGLGIIFVTEDSEDGAYDIFETLNARGLGLSNTDLIKNDICRSMTGEHPEDTARRLWAKIAENISKRSKDVKFTSFFRHFWLSNYEYRTESRIYRSYRDRSRKGEIVASEFLDHLQNESENYAKILDPEMSDWTHMNGGEIYKSLRAISLFKVTQVRTFLMAVIHLSDKRIIGTKEISKTFKLVENFHFIFSTICSQRPSGLEIKYSALARKARNIKDKGAFSAVIAELQSYYKDKIPEKSIFLENTKKVWYSRNISKNGILVKYIYANIEKHLGATVEVDLDACSIEHICPESTDNPDAKEIIGILGNLVLLDRRLNTDAGSKSFEKKKEIYKNSSLKQIKELLNTNKETKIWDAVTILNRQEEISQIMWLAWTEVFDC